MICVRPPLLDSCRSSKKSRDSETVMNLSCLKAATTKLLNSVLTNKAKVANKTFYITQYHTNDCWLKILYQRFSTKKVQTVNLMHICIIIIKSYFSCTEWPEYIFLLVKNLPLSWQYIDVLVRKNPTDYQFKQLPADVTEKVNTFPCRRW